MAEGVQRDSRKLSRWDRELERAAHFYFFFEKGWTWQEFQEAPEWIERCLPIISQVMSEIAAEKAKTPVSRET